MAPAGIARVLKGERFDLGDETPVRWGDVSC